MALSQGETSVRRPPSHWLVGQAGKQRFPPHVVQVRMALLRLLITSSPSTTARRSVHGCRPGLQNALACVRRIYEPRRDAFLTVSMLQQRSVAGKNEILISCAFDFQAVDPTEMGIVRQERHSAFQATRTDPNVIFRNWSSAALEYELDFRID